VKTVVGKVVFLQVGRITCQ